MKALIGYFAARPSLVNLAVLLVVVAGVLSLLRAQYNAFPAFDAGEPLVVGYRPGASAEDMELSVTAPLEEELLKVDGIEEFRSVSMAGASIIELLIDPDLDARQSALVRRDLQQAVDRATSRLPNDLSQKPQIIDSSTDRSPVVELLVTGKVPESTLRQYVRKLEQGLREVDGVGGISRRGYRNRELQLKLDPLRLHQLGLSIDDIEGAINRRNLRSSAGTLHTESGDSQVLTVGEFRLSPGTGKSHRSHRWAWQLRASA